ncbi:ADP-ribosylation factor-related protein 1-like, partial [Sinocyclocheilus rhinocerous]|uniref:ADP-ribosylation factor-related protein 1-like n=1 Tax=Sinocyclocheilus rhinocerous TaxID=307959 RepID=UPI0007B7F25B
MISSEVLEGVPLLVLANKQDVENCLSVSDIKTAFSDCAPKIGKRDCLVQPCCALSGYVCLVSLIYYSVETLLRSSTPKKHD